MINQFRHQLPAYRLCDLLDVPRSGYQAWCSGKFVSARKLADQRFLVFIKAARAKGRGIYGALKIQAELAAQCIMAGINRIERLRKLYGIRFVHKKKFRVTTDSKHHLPVVANLLNRQFAPTAQNQVWVANITYIPTNEGCLRLAAVKDLQTCEIVG